MKQAVVALNHAQIDSLAKLVADKPRRYQVLVQQTISATGGVHIYALLGKKDEFHVARNGNATLINNNEEE